MLLARFSLNAGRSPKRFWMCVLLISSCSSCSRPLTDDKLIDEFNKNRQLFAELASQADLQNLDCPHPNDPNICVPKGSDEVVKELKRKTGFDGMQAYVRTGPQYALWVPVQLTGYLSTSTSVFGYVYTRSELSPLVGTVWNDLEQRQAFKRIAGNWYLFVSN
jgi:hypothetical protein